MSKESAEVCEFLSTPRTLKEISKLVGVPKLTSNMIRALVKESKGWSIFEQQTRDHQQLFMTVKDQESDGLPKKIWTHWVDTHGEPYIWIQFPADLKLDRIRIVPLSDVHYGAKAHNNKRFLKYISWIQEMDNVFTILNGDIIENALGDSIGGAVYESTLTPDEQLWGSKDGKEPGIINLLRPISHKILWAQPGNHEWRTWKHTNIDPMKIICRELKIPYFSEPIYADVLAWGHRFTFYCHHGNTGSNTKGGKLNAASKPAEFQEAVDFVIMGHVHDSMVNPLSRVVRKREFDPEGNLISFKLEERAQYVVICPSFYGYFQSYGSRAGYSPGSWGSVSCTLFNNGGYQASE